MNKDIRQKVYKKYNCKCAYCGNALEYKKMQVDHIYPKHLGGKDVFNNYNPSCRECNFYKSTFTIEGFRNQIATILDRVKKPFIVRLAIKYGLLSYKPFDGLFYFEKHKQALSINDVGCSLPKVCTGCGSLSTKVINKKYLACCPDNQYIKLEDYCKECL